MVLAILQARVSSTRLPGKVLKHILGKPMLMRQIERINRSKCIDHLVVATSKHELDDALEALCAKHNISCFRGSLGNVLERFYQAALEYKPDHIVRLTGDCPLCDFEIIDRVINFYLEGDFDYVSNATTPTFPDGLDVEVFSFETLKKVKKNVRLNSDKEHVTPFITKNRHMFKTGNFSYTKDLSFLRWTVDEIEDFELVKIVYEELYFKNNFFVSKDILDLLERRPELKNLNTYYKRNEGYHTSLKQDNM